VATTSTCEGLSFADLSVGMEMCSEECVEITGENISAYAVLSHDMNPIHLSEEHAKKSRYGTRIAHGAYGVSLATGLASALGFTKEDVFFEEFVHWRFLRAVKIGDILRLKIIVMALVSGNKLKPRTHPPKAELEVTLLNQNDREVQKGIWIARFERAS